MTIKQRREFTPEFKREAVGLLASSGRTIRQIAGDLGLGLSTLNKRKTRHLIETAGFYLVAGACNHH